MDDAVDHGLAACLRICDAPEGGLPERIARLLKPGNTTPTQTLSESASVFFGSCLTRRLTRWAMSMLSCPWVYAPEPRRESACKRSQAGSRIFRLFMAKFPCVPVEQVQHFRNRSTAISIPLENIDSDSQQLSSSIPSRRELVNSRAHPGARVG